MRIRKILGGVTLGGLQARHSIGKLDDNRYVVGNITLGDTAQHHQSFSTFDAAYDHWYASLQKHAPCLRDLLKPTGASDYIYHAGHIKNSK